MRTDERDALGSPAEEDAVSEMWLVWPKHHEQSHAVQRFCQPLTGCLTGLITLKKGENVQLITRLQKVTYEY